VVGWPAQRDVVSNTVVLATSSFRLPVITSTIVSAAPTILPQDCVASLSFLSQLSGLQVSSQVSQVVPEAEVCAGVEPKCVEGGQPDVDARPAEGVSLMGCPEAPGPDIRLLKTPCRYRLRTCSHPNFPRDPV